jgi:ribosome-associated toxin RatA of RatAB toxin-antitoxin module
MAIDIAAPPDLVFGLARDPLRWPALLPHYSRARLVERATDASIVAEFVARRPLVGLLGLGIPVAWRSRTWAEPVERRLRFVHRGGATDGMDVTWRIEPTALGTRVTIEHLFAPRVPLLGAIVQGYFVRPIAGRTLGTFKAIAEAVAAIDGAPPTPAASAELTDG